ncbi:unnamed protein product [Camellia sinensis]
MLCVEQIQGQEWKIHESLIDDVRGMLSLYEATHLRLHGEDVLDEALAFTTIHLESVVPNLSNHLQEQVIHALNQPIHHDLTRLESRRYIFVYEQDDSHNEKANNFCVEPDLGRDLEKGKRKDVRNYVHELGFFLNLSPPNTWDCSINSKALELPGPYQPQASHSTLSQLSSYHLGRSFPHICLSCRGEVDVKMGQLLQQQKEEVRKMLVAANDQPSQKLNFIDAIQRLGVSYYFESEIETALQHIYKTDYDHHDDKANDDLYTVALLFRLLRQQGYSISCDVFNKFKDDNGKICESLIGDVRGLLNLYEAAHLRLRGEDILDEALSFTITHLESEAPNLSNLAQEQIIHALNQPIHKGLTRLEATRNFFFYEQDDSHNKVLLSFAKLDFNLLQKKAPMEAKRNHKWWKELDFAKKLSFAKDRIVECYFWVVGVYFEPQYLLARRMLTKVIALTSIIDDIYDVYGTLEELVLFTDAIERWEISAIDQLPEYMKPCYQALLDVYNMIDEEMARKGRSYRIHYAKSAMKNLVRAYFEEAKWFHQGYVPSIEEYMRVALVTCGYTMLATTSFVGMGEVVSKEAFGWVSGDPLIVQASSVVNGLMDDMVSHEFEQQRGHVVSAVECYMKQYGASEEEVLFEFRNQVTNAWKDINQECLRPTTILMPLLLRVVNLARLMDVLYRTKMDTHILEPSSKVL